MKPAPASLGQKLLRHWECFQKIPLIGKALYSLYLSLLVPYSGSVRPRVLVFQKGKVELLLRDHPDFRNHLKSVHAIALSNIAELASGLAVISSLPPGARSIVTRLEIDYYKKSRGDIRAVSEFAWPEGESSKSTTLIAVAHLYDSRGDQVSQMKAHWRIDF
jgi:acyl-coenzyme A thioesterase PaaI-like protein